MSEESFLSGKVRRTRLPIFTQPTGADAPILKRLLLPQGELAQFHDSDEAMRYMALIELKADGVRGNHVHRRKREYVYLISGSINLLVENLTDGQKANLPVTAGELVVIEPEVAHALRTREPGQAIEYSPSRFDPADTFRHMIMLT